MSEQKIISHSKNGFLLHCCGCNNYQLAFGTSILSFTEEQLQDFTEMVLEEDFSDCKSFPQRKLIQLPTFTEHVMLIVTYNEWLELSNMFVEHRLLNQVKSWLA